MISILRRSIVFLMLSVWPCHAQPSSVRADSFGIAIGGSVTNATIIAGIPQDKVDDLIRERTRPFEELTSAQRETINLLRQTLDLNQRQIYAALEILGEATIPPEKIAAKLVELAERLKQLRDIAAASPGDDPETTSFKHQAEQAISNGDLSLADSLLAKVEERQRRTVDKLAVNVANTLAQRGKIALTRFRYLEAGQLFGQAVDLVPRDQQYKQLRKEYMEARASALGNEGLERGDTTAAQSAVDQYRELLRMGDNSPDARETITYGLARSLLTLSYRDGNLQHMRDAIAALREELNQSDNTKPGAPRIFLKQQLAITLTGLGVFEVSESEVLLSEAVDLFRSMLSEDYIRESKNTTAQALGALGFALTALASARNDHEIDRDAAETMRQSIANFDPENQALDWARANAFLGVILAKTGLGTGDRAVLSEAIPYFRASLTKITRDRLPLEWASVQMVYGTALLWLGRETKDSSTLDGSVEALKASHQVLTAANAPTDWAISNCTLGEALLELGKITGDRRFLTEARIRFDLALSMKDRVPHSLDWERPVKGNEEAQKLMAGNKASKK
jgi:tetratricopeptide (TPR) repeat protein